MEDVVVTEVPVRYEDLDPVGQVNNVAYGSYCEEGRLAWAGRTLAAAEDGPFEPVLASRTLNFREPIEDTGTVTVEVWLAAVGASSFTLSYRIRRAEVLVADGESVHVYRDPETGTPEPIPDGWRDHLGALVVDR